MKINKFFFTKLIILFGLNFSFVFSDQIIEKNKNNLEKQVEELEKKISSDERSLLELEKDSYKFKLSFKNRTETFYGRSLELFSPSQLDQVLYWQSTWDLKFSTSVGKCIRSDVVLRNKARWGNINSINHVTENEVKLKDAVTGKHKHALGKLFFWMREGWVEFLINDAFNIQAQNRHYLKVGAFPFKLGRGISLGEAYAVSAGLLGFYSNNVIDQYAFGVLCHGDLVKDKLSYDIYGAILENQSDSFNNVNDKVFAMEIGRRDTPARGFGHINFLFASKLDWILHPCNVGNLTVEPYILFNINPEQKIDFPSDASSKLATPGLYVDYENDKFEFGVEYAMNIGHQSVRAWDRNKVLLDRATDGAAVFDYSHVLTKDPNVVSNPPKALESNKNKNIVNNSPQNASDNGKQIDSTGLYNSLTRFRKAYTNKYAGFMIVADGAYWFNDDLKLAATIGMASGDEDPNQDVDDPNDSDVDGVYSGFIGLQEIYNGKRVQSVFVIGPNRIPRPLSFPSREIPDEDLFASNISGFTNLVYGGVGVEWTTCGCKKEFTLRPNLLAYWQESPTKKFSIEKKMTINQFASKFLGTELNLFLDVKLLKNLKGFFVGGMFVPGQHFKDIKGKPLNADQREILDDLDSTGENNDNSDPILGTNTAWSLNWGFEYQF